MTLSPDDVALFTLGPWTVTATLAYTWLVMTLLVVGSALVTRGLTAGGDLGRGQNLGNYLRPSPFLLPFTIIGELSRTLALAVRLFGNIMGGSVIAVILLSVAPLLFPVVMQVFGLLIGVIQAYIFAVLAIVYIASGTEAQERTARTRAEEAGT